MTSLVHRSVPLVLVLACLAGCGDSTPPAQTAPATAPAAAAPAATAKKEFAFRGKVESVDPATKSMSVAGEDVPGWMMAMTMVYKPDKPEVIDQIKAGDQITATVYEGDTSTLHDVKVVPATK